MKYHWKGKTLRIVICQLGKIIKGQNHDAWWLQHDTQSICMTLVTNPIDGSDKDDKNGYE